jgi:hypothetical protein
MKTSVEFMVEQLNKSMGLINFVDTCNEEYKHEILCIIKQAKEMEKQQIVEAHMSGQHYDDLSARKEAEQYYNKTYGKDGRKTD